MKPCRSKFIYPLDEARLLPLAKALAIQPYTLFFDSADRSHPLSRYSFVAFYPIETIEGKNGRCRLTTGDHRQTLSGDPFQILRDRLSLWDPVESHPELPPFQGGAAGCFGYDLARGLEKLPETAANDPNMPDMMVGIYDQVMAFDHHKRKGWFITHAKTEQEAAQRRAALDRLPPPDPAGPAPPLQFKPVLSRADYETRLRRVIDYVHAGDIFQANLSQRFSAILPPDFDAFAHYLHLRTVNPAPFAAWMNFGGVRLSSASPERFLHVSNGQVETRPIKGTARRSTDPDEDQEILRRLPRSEKDRAENVMIVDLLRNDLSRVCHDHSVEVPALCQPESFARVHHLVSIVKGVLKPDRDALDCLRACFPGGSVTGAPKIRAMEIIEALEPKRRGPYCGALGYIGFNGTMDTNIAIRTLVYQGDRVHFNVGGGVVADSDPGQEYQETLDKAEGLLSSFAPSSLR